MTQTNKPLVFPRLTPVLLPIFLLASVFMITACGGKKSTPVANTFTPPPPPPPPPTFTSRVIQNVPADIQSGITNIFAETTQPEHETLLENLGRKYLRRIPVNIPTEADAQTLVLQGERDIGGLGEQDGFLMIFATEQGKTFAHSVVGMFDTTDVGAVLDSTTSATFSGKYTVRLLAFPPATPEDRDPAPLSESILAEDITLNVDFGNSTIKGETGNVGTARLTVDGNFGANRLTGTVTFRERTSNEPFEAPLTGLIGQDGAVGIFSSSNNGTGIKYSFGGGFVVEPDTE